VLDPDDNAKRCDLLLAQGEAMLPLEEPAKVASTAAAEAFSLAEAIGDPHRAARAAVMAAEGLVRAGYDRHRPDVLEWGERAARHASPGTKERVYADIYRGLASTQLVSPAAGHVFLRAAIEQALQLDDTPLVFAAGGWVFRQLRALQDLERRERLAYDILDRPRSGARAGDLGTCLFGAAHVLLGQGDRDRAEAAWQELADLAERTRDATLGIQAQTRQVILAAMDGHLEEAMKLKEAATAAASEGGIAVGERSYLPFYLGRVDERALDGLDRPTRPVQSSRSLVLAYLGRHAEARAIRERFVGIESDDDETSASILLELFEGAILGQEAGMARALSRRLAPFADRLARIEGGAGISVGRLLGDAAVLLGQPAEARIAFGHALDICARARFRPEGALARLHLAELLLGHYPQEQAEALAHLDFAVEEFRAMKMQPSLERALRHKGLLHA
jgi:tetratricopeptide (TPR) repeat protein